MLKILHLHQKWMRFREMKRFHAKNKNVISIQRENYYDTFSFHGNLTFDQFLLGLEPSQSLLDYLQVRFSMFHASCSFLERSLLTALSLHGTISGTVPTGRPWPAATFPFHGTISGTVPTLLGTVPRTVASFLFDGTIPGAWASFPLNRPKMLASIDKSSLLKKEFQLLSIYQYGFALHP